MATDHEIVDALHGLDSARRVGWARAYAAEEENALLQDNLEFLRSKVEQLQALAVQAEYERLQLTYALHYALGYRDDEGRLVHGAADWIEALVGGFLLDAEFDEVSLSSVETLMPGYGRERLWSLMQRDSRFSLKDPTETRDAMVALAHPK